MNAAMTANSCLSELGNADPLMEHLLEPKDVDKCSGHDSAVDISMGLHEQTPQSKAQQKRLRNEEQFVKWKRESRLRKKQKRQEEHKLASEQGIAWKDWRIQQGRKPLEPVFGKLRKERVLVTEKFNEIVSPYAVAVDCAFTSVMTDREIKSFIRQLSHCYAANSRCSSPVHFYITDFGESLSARSDSAQLNLERWRNVHITPNSLDKTFPAGGERAVVYLSSEGEEVLDALDPKAVYVIGGLVDHNRLKGHVFRYTQQFGYRCVRLPLEKHISLTSRKVLTVNHVMNILLRFIVTSSWAESFVESIPLRKGVSALPVKEDEDISGTDELVSDVLVDA